MTPGQWKGCLHIRGRAGSRPGSSCAPPPLASQAQQGSEPSSATRAKPQARDAEQAAGRRASPRHGWFFSPARLFILKAGLSPHRPSSGFRSGGARDEEEQEKPTNRSQKGQRGRREEEAREKSRSSRSFETPPGLVSRGDRVSSEWRSPDLSSVENSNSSA